MSGGEQANKTGKTLETFVKRLLQDYGYMETELKRMKKDKKVQFFENRNALAGKNFAAQVPCGTSIYETSRRCDFLVINKEKFQNGLIIECKWQQAKGSVDEKYPFTVLNIRKIGIPTIIILDGAGYKKEAFAWIKSQVNPNESLDGVYTMSGFQKEVNKGFLG